MKNLLTASLIIFGSVFASAESFSTQEIQTKVSAINWQQFWAQQDIRNLNWQVGDLVEFDMKISVLPGTMLMFISSIEGSTAILNQELSIATVKQSCDMHFNLNTGELLKMVCAGQEQKPGPPGESEIIEMKEAQVTVPAGTFQTVYIKAVTGEKKQVVEQWINRSEIPILGIVQSLTPSAIGTMTMKLKAFKKM